MRIMMVRRWNMSLIHKGSLFQIVLVFVCSFIFSTVSGSFAGVSNELAEDEPLQTLINEVKQLRQEFKSCAAIKRQF
jgi:hypothetical protein